MNLFPNERLDESIKFFHLERCCISLCMHAGLVAGNVVHIKYVKYFLNICNELRETFGRDGYNLSIYFQFGIVKLLIDNFSEP